MLSEQEFSSTYKEINPSYNRLAMNLKIAIETILDEKDIPILDITSRIKTPESAWEKITRKNYNDPFTQIEDWCGLRIVCYYPSDIKKITELLREEFHVETEEDTSQRLKAHEFGYRSTHFILRIKDSWLTAPQYRGLADIKAEVQVRTILMHAWAEIEHKLAYKSEKQVPDMFRRKLYRLSAKFEETDEQFEELRLGLGKYRESVIDTAKEGLASFRNRELNLDTFQVLLDTAYPGRRKTHEGTATLLGEIEELSLTMGDIIDAIEAQSPIIKQIEHFGLSNTNRLEWAQVGAMRNALDISCDKYYKKRLKSISKNQRWISKVHEGRKLLGRPI